MTSKLAVEAGSTTDYHTGDWRTQRPAYQYKWPPCSQTCPASEDIQAWLALATDGEWEAAWRKLTERNPFPAVMGRVCYHPCEAACNRKHLDDAVNIHGVERCLGDMALEQGWHHRPLTQSKKTHAIAVVGAGPAGLSCAFQLARCGYAVTIFDAAAAPGGTLRSGIPDYRLPKTVLADEINAILALGIKLRLDTRVGIDVNENDLRDEFDAVFLAIGAQRPRLYQDGESSNPAVMSGIDFLRRLNAGETFALSKQVAVIGGGNTAIDVARCARRLGAEVTVVCAQDPHSAHHAQLGTEMPASLREVIEAEAENVRLLNRFAVRRLVCNGEHLSGVEIARVDQVHDRHGHFNPLLFEGTEEFLPAGQVIFAIGQEVDWRGLESLSRTEASGVWLGGDAAGKPRLAATAVGSGYQAAMSIMASFKGEAAPHDAHQKAQITFKKMQLHYYPKQRRYENLINECARADFSEVVSGLATEDANNEAGRCLSCGVCFECDNCWHFCPDAAVIKTNSGYQIDYDYCKGCGICAQECPCGHIDMEPVME